ncbi:MAG: T9SS C-terminal target domain-containing protein [Saprospiraceae bacterium]|nr:T9SS C-terminal target domain-containing protein [Saprospiraceae bacterium]
MMNPRFLLTSLLATAMMLWPPSAFFAQNTDFSIALEKIDVSNLPGFQSAAVAHFDNKIIILGGRTDGLHRRQPFASFLPDGNNTNLILLTPSTGAFSILPLTGLSTAQQEQLQSTNIQFCQYGPWLYLTGGYGYSATLGDHTTHPLLTVVRLDSLLWAIDNNTDISPWFRSVSDPQFAVTGGQLVRQGEVFYLAGGHRFEGRYNPMNHPTFEQTYTNAIRRFTVALNDDAPSVAFLPAWTDEANLQRRDYNLAPQVFPTDGHLGFTMFSGVFTPVSELPYLNSVDFDSSGYAVNNTFQHRLNQYHCAKIALYDAPANRMHTVFLGGIAQFFFNSQGQLIQDDNVPFVRTIGRVTRFPDGSVLEEKIGDMPGFLGAGAEFIPLSNLPLVAGADILSVDQFVGDSTLVGYLIGGIESDLPNVFFSSPETQSRAHAALYKVWYKPEQTQVGISAPPLVSPCLKVRLTPNPAQNTVRLSFTLDRPALTSVLLQTPASQTIVMEDMGTLAAGEHHVEFRLDNFPNGIYPVTLIANQFVETLNLVISR